MTGHSGETANPFWTFSLRLYGLDGVASACLALQDRFGADVNLVLYALWRVEQGAGAWGGAECRAAMASVAPLSRQVIQPLRAVRKSLAKEGEEAALREAVKNLELEAEKLEQDRLFAASPGLSGAEAKDRDASEAALAVYAEALEADRTAFLKAAGPLVEAFCVA
ncbi:MAG: TIGR02444 family protein [Alphaproteobacteria bacterium]|nr:TIGR02444 family protein [Alphaproteobacteria bacterium]